MLHRANLDDGGDFKRLKIFRSKTNRRDRSAHCCSQKRQIMHSVDWMSKIHTFLYYVMCKHIFFCFLHFQILMGIEITLKVLVCNTHLYSNIKSIHIRYTKRTNLMLCLLLYCILHCMYGKLGHS